MWCMATLLGHDVRYKAHGSVIVDGKKGKSIDHGFVSFSTYYYKWMTSYPQLKVSWRAEDICEYYFAFLNHHRYLTNHWQQQKQQGVKTIMKMLVMVTSIYQP